MRLLRGPYFVVACLLAVGIGVVLGGGWFWRAWVQVAPTNPPAPANLSGGVEGVFLKMDAALLKAFAFHNPVCAGPGGACTAKSERISSFVSYRRGGSFRLISLSVAGQTNTTASFELRIDFETGDRRLIMNEQEKQSVFEIARGYGFGENERAALVDACKAMPDLSASDKTVKAGDITFSCRVLPRRGDFLMNFKGPVPRHFGVAG
jgi:hypothetical protein